MYYTGIGSRETPLEILNIMEQLGNIFSTNYILRSGAADGADKAFEKYANKKDIYLPWKSFNNSNSQLYNISPKAFELASVHPYWNNLKPAVKKLMARNVHQVLGLGLDTPSDFLICWTPDGASTKEEVNQKTGGTGLAITIADLYNVPVFNLQREDILDSIKEQYKL